MIRATLGLLLTLACASCAAPPSQTASTSDCSASAQDGQVCPGQLGVHMGGSVQFGVGSAR
jgi:hypothetical protein